MLHLTLTPRTLRFRKPAATSRGALTVREILLVEARTPQRPGAVGLGEAGPIPGLSADDAQDWTARAATAVDRFNAAQLSLPGESEDPLLAASNLLAPLDELLCTLPSLRFGVETAVLDLIRGGQGRLFSSAFMNEGAPLRTHGLLWMDTAEGMLEQAASKVAAGFAVLKMKVGAAPLEQELALLATLRDRYPQVGLRLDANGAFSLGEAFDMLRAIAPFGVECVEQPIPPGRPDALEMLRDTPVAVGLDEEWIALSQPERLRLLERLAAAGGRQPVVILKPALLGGFGPATEMAAACRRLGLSCQVHSLLEAAPGHNAICQWAAWLAERFPESVNPVHGLGTGMLFANNLPSPIGLEGPALVWRG